MKTRTKRLQKESAPVNIECNVINRFMSLLACEEDRLPSIFWEEGEHILKTKKATVIKKKESWKSWISADTVVEFEREEK